MKNTKRVLLIFLVSVLMAAVSLFAAACSPEEETPPPPAAPQQYTITFMVGTVPYGTVTGEAGSALTPPADPERANLHFDGWSEEENGTVVALPQTVPAENKTYYAVFSARYTLTLDAGIGTLGAGAGTLSVKAGDNLFDLVKDIAPVAPGDSTFGGWFYGGNKLTAQSDAVMPAGSVTVSAKYEVGYTVDVYTQTEYGVNDYSEPESRSGTGYVGDLITGISYPTGYNIDTQKSNNSSPLGTALACNAFEVYFNLVDYQVIFNPNLPASANVQGSMDNATWGHNKEYAAPASGYTAAGYRFIGWSTSIDEDAEIYAPGESISVTSVTNLYCRWVKGLTDYAEKSSDLVYIIDDHALLERIGYEDYRGTYSAATKEFVFVNSNNDVIVRGVADAESGTFIYLLDSADSSYVLRYVSDGSDGPTAIDGNVSLKLNADGSAVYNAGGAAGAVTGTYSLDEEEKELKFTAGDNAFYFRTDNDNGTPVFEIRGEEYGVWFKVNATGVLDGTFYMALDGYGAITVYSIGLDKNLQKQITTTVNGYYWYNEKTETVTEYAALLLNSNSQYKVTVFRLFDDKNYGTEENPINNVYIEKSFGVTLYGRPGEDETLDKTTADNIVLDGYGVYNDSAVYTYYSNGAPVVIKGTYSYDSAMRMVVITPKTPASAPLKFALYAVENQEESYDFLFEPAERIYGEYTVNNLDKGNLRPQVYPLRIYNGNVAAFAFLLPMANEFYGNYKMDYVSDVIVGTLEYDDRLAEYTYSAEVDPKIAQLLYLQYYQIAQTQFDVSGFGSFKFTISYSESECNVTARGDYTVGATVVYDGVVYTTDGYGKAVGADGSVKDYTVSNSFGIPSLTLSWGTGENAGSQLYLYVNGGYSAYQTEYRIINVTGVINLALLENNVAILVNSVPSGYSSKFTVYSVGTVTWEEGTDNGFGVYRETEALNSSVAVIIKDINEFRFGFTTVLSSNKRVTVVFAYDAPAAVVDNKHTIASATEGSLVIDRAAATAKYTDAEGVVAEGNFSYYDDIITITYTVGEGEDARTEAVRLQLIYDGQNVTSFKKVGIETGKWMFTGDTRSYIVLDGVGNALLHEYNDETSQMDEPTVGWYRATDNETRSNEFEFFEGEKPATVPADAQPLFKFIVGISSGMRLFQVYVDEIAPEGYGRPVFANNGGSMTRVGMLSGGGYSDQTFTLGGMYEFTGVFGYLTSSPFNAVEQGEDSPEIDIYAFVSDDGYTFYFAAITIEGSEDKMYVYLDSTVAAPNFGRFQYVNAEGCTVKVPVLEGEEWVTREITVKGLLLSGFGEAALITDGENGSEEYYICSYISGSNNTFMLAALAGEEVAFITTFRLYVRTVEENREYYTVFIDSEFIDDETRYITFKNVADMSSIRFDGYGSALFVDGKGVAHTAVYERLEAHPEVLRVRYISGTFAMSEMYVTITATENADGTFTYTYTVLDADDERIPVETPDPEPDPSTPDPTV